MRNVSRVLLSVVVALLLVVGLTLPVGATGSLHDKFNQFSFVSQLIFPTTGQLGSDYQVGLYLENSMYNSGFSLDQEDIYYHMCLGGGDRCDTEVGAYQDIGSTGAQAIPYAWSPNTLGCALGTFAVEHNRFGVPTMCQIDLNGIYGGGNLDTVELKWYNGALDWTATITDYTGAQHGLAIVNVAEAVNSQPTIQVDEAWSTQEVLNPFYAMSMWWANPQVYSTTYGGWLGWPTDGTYGQHNTLVTASTNGTPYCPYPYQAQDQSFVIGLPFWHFGSNLTGNPPPVCGSLDMFGRMRGARGASAPLRAGGGPSMQPLPPRHPALFNGKPTVDATGRAILGGIDPPDVDLTPSMALEDKLSVIGQLPDGSYRRYLLDPDQFGSFATLVPAGTKIVARGLPESFYLAREARNRAARG